MAWFFFVDSVTTDRTGFRSSRTGPEPDNDAAPNPHQTPVNEQHALTHSPPKNSTQKKSEWTHHLSTEDSETITAGRPRDAPPGGSPSARARALEFTNASRPSVQQSKRGGRARILIFFIFFFGRFQKSEATFTHPPFPTLSPFWLPAYFICKSPKRKKSPRRRRGHVRCLPVVVFSILPSPSPPDDVATPNVNGLGEGGVLLPPQPISFCVSA